MTSVLAAVAAGLTVLMALSGCSDGVQRSSRDGTDGEATPSTGVARTDSGASPIIFAFTCDHGAGASTTYTTYSAVWDADERACDARTITGSVPSAQQRAALEAAGAGVTLARLAATCAVRGVEPWDTAVTTPAQAAFAAGLEQYCPGHPEMDRLRDAVAAYRG